MLTTGELDALGALLREQDEADEALRGAEVEYALATSPYGKDRAMAKRGVAALAVVEARSATARAAGTALSRLLAAAREAETLRAQLDALKAQRDRVTNEVFKDVPPPDAEAIFAALDRIEERIKGGGRMCIDVVMTDAVDMAADVFDDEGELLPPLEQLAALLLLRSASSDWVRQVCAAGHEAWTAKQNASAKVRLGEAAR